MTLALHMLRELVADHIERLIAFLDATESDADLEPECREDDPAESGIGDMDGMLEQLSSRSGSLRLLTPAHHVRNSAGLRLDAAIVRDGLPRVRVR